MSRRSYVVIFDLDGVLIDSEPLWRRSGEMLLARRGREPDERLRQRTMGRGPLEVARLFVAHYGLSDLPEALAEERLELQRGLYLEGIDAGGAAPSLPGAAALVEALAAARIPLAVASGSPTNLVQLCLRWLGMEGRFRVVLGSDQVSRGKPAPDLFLRTALDLASPPVRSLVIEDSDAGVRAARAAGMRCVRLGPPHAEADISVESLEDLPVERLDSLW